MRNCHGKWPKSWNFMGFSWGFPAVVIANKLSCISGILCRLKDDLPKYILQTIYHSLFLEHLKYGITTRGFHDCNRWKQLQKKVIRIKSNSNYSAHTSPLFKELKLLKIDYLFKLSCYKVYYKYKQITSLFQNSFNVNVFIKNSDSPRTI